MPPLNSVHSIITAIPLMLFIGASCATNRDRPSSEDHPKAHEDHPRPQVIRPEYRSMFYDNQVETIDALRRDRKALIAKCMILNGNTSQRCSVELVEIEQADKQYVKPGDRLTLWGAPDAPQPPGGAMQLPRGERWILVQRVLWKWHFLMIGRPVASPPSDSK